MLVRGAWEAHVDRRLPADMLTRRWLLCLFRRCSFIGLLNRRDLVQVRQDHRRDEVVLATLVRLVEAARQSNTVLVHGSRVGAGTAINLRNAVSAFRL